MREFFVSGFVIFDRYLSYGDPIGTGRRYLDNYELVNTSTLGDTVLRTYEYIGPRQALIRADSPARALEIADDLDRYEREYGPACVVRFDKN